MRLVFSLIVVPEERVIEPELENQCQQRQRNRKQRQDSEFARAQITSVNGHQHQPERTVDHAPDAEDQRMFNRLCDLVVYRCSYSRLRLTVRTIIVTSVIAATAMLT